MSFPWPSFSNFIFETSEMPIRGSDSRWKRQPKRDRSSNLGSATDSIRTLAIGSAVRTFDIYLEPDRFIALEAKIGLTDTFTDWDAPVPATGQAYLSAVDPIEDVAMICTDGSTKRKTRTRVEFLSQ